MLVISIILLIICLILAIINYYNLKELERRQSIDIDKLHKIKRLIRRYDEKNAVSRGSANEYTLIRDIRKVIYTNNEA